MLDFPPAVHDVPPPIPPPDVVTSAWMPVRCAPASTDRVNVATTCVSDEPVAPFTEDSSLTVSSTSPVTWPVESGHELIFVLLLPVPFRSAVAPPGAVVFVLDSS